MKEIITMFSMAIMTFTGIAPTKTNIPPIVEVMTVQDISTIEEAQDYINEFHPELYNVAVCESSWRAEAKNPISSATGIYQFLDSTAVWVYDQIYNQELDMANKNDIALQVEMAIWLYERYELSQWAYPCGTLVM